MLVMDNSIAFDDKNGFRNNLTDMQLEHAGNINITRIDEIASP
jgi:hypothetical protein